MRTRQEISSCLQTQIVHDTKSQTLTNLVIIELLLDLRDLNLQIIDCLKYKK